MIASGGDPATAIVTLQGVDRPGAENSLPVVIAQEGGAGIAEAGSPEDPRCGTFPVAGAVIAMDQRRRVIGRRHRSVRQGWGIAPALIDGSCAAPEENAEEESPPQLAEIAERTSPEFFPTSRPMRGTSIFWLRRMVWDAQMAHGFGPLHLEFVR